jgi:hypothetical protein
MHISFFKDKDRFPYVVAHIVVLAEDEKERELLKNVTDENPNGLKKVIRDFITYTTDIKTQEKKLSMTKDDIIELIKNAAREIESWPKWRPSFCGVESNYCRAIIDLYKLIRTEEEYKTVLKRIEDLIDIDPQQGTDLADELDLLSLLINRYEYEKDNNHMPYTINDLKCCGNCSYRSVNVSVDGDEEYCIKGNLLSSWGKCTNWKYNGLNGVQ